LQLCLGVYLGPSFAIAQTLAPIKLRAMSTALFFFVLNMIALGGGPTFAGAMIDVFINKGAGELGATRSAMYVTFGAYILAFFFYMLVRKIPKSAAKNIWDRGGSAEFDVAKIDEIEREVKHDVIAFLTHLATFIGDDARFVHQGFTSSDILDTTLSVQLARATDLLLVAKEMGLEIEPVSSQVIPRDRHAAYFATLGVVASSIENIAVEIRHLQRTEVLEAEEFFSKGQKGSSAMPHKRNPVLTENLTGLARLVRMAVVPAMENVALWHERDISHSSVERGIGPDSTVHLDFALHRLAGVIENLVVYPDKMKANMDRLGGLHNSQRFLLALTQAGEQRESAYRLVQRNAMKVWDGYHLKFVDAIFKRVFG